MVAFDPWDIAFGATITNNDFDLMFSPNSGIWGPLFPNSVPSGVEWSGNSYDLIYPISLQYALSL